MITALVILAYLVVGFLVSLVWGFMDDVAKSLLVGDAVWALVMILIWPIMAIYLCALIIGIPFSMLYEKAYKCKR